MLKLEKAAQMSDLEVLSKILNGDVALYEIIIRRYNPYLFKIGRSYGYNQQDTEDLIQDTFISAYKNLEKFENRSSLKTWLTRIMLNFCYHKRRKSSYKNEISSNSIENGNGTPLFAQSGTNTTKTVMNNELKHILEDAILQISDDYRLVFTLRELNGMSIKETSEALNISESNVKIRLKRAKGLLRNEIQKMYSPDDIFEFNLIYCNRIVQNVLNYISTEQKSSTKGPKWLQFKDRLWKWMKMNGDQTT